MNRYFSAFAFLFVIFLIMIAIYFYKPVTFNEVSTVDGFVSYSKSLGLIMPVFIFSVTVIQASIPAVPFVVLCSANGVLFGIINGILFTWIATLSGAAILFFLSRKFGYKWAETFANKYHFNHIKKLEGQNGFITILVLRLLPYFPAPLINVFAGVSNMSFTTFIGASALGKLPFIIGYTLMGYSILKTKNYLFGVSVFLLLMIIPYMFKKLNDARNRKTKLKKE